MAKRNENIEDFFKNSLDKWNESPSDRIWDKLDDRLEQDKSKGILWWFKYIFPIILLGLVTSGMYVSHQSKFTYYETQLTNLIQENAELKIGLTEVQEISKNASRSENERIISQTKTETKTVFIRDTILLIKYMPTQIASTAYQVPSFNFDDAAHTVHYLTLSGVTVNGQKSNTFQPQANSITWPNRLPPLDLTTHRLHSKIEDQKIDRRLRYVPVVHTNKEGRKKSKQKSNTAGIVMVNELDPWGQPDFYYRAGISISSLNSLKGDIFSSSAIGFATGLVQEIGLSTRFAITSGVSINFQDYALSNNNAALTANQLESFPFQSELPNNITRVEVDNKFFEFPLGVKYDLYQDNLKSFFINPSLKWSVHRPQTFNYQFGDGSLSQFSSNRKFGYLNALSMSVGIEKAINPMISYQLSIGYDQSIEPIGVEQQRLNTLFVKGNLLFGKK